MANYSTQDLQDNLDYLNETKKQIKQAIIDKRTDYTRLRHFQKLRR